MRGLIVPRGHNNPPAIIPLTHSKVSRESGDYASSDIQVLIFLNLFKYAHFLSRPKLRG